MSNYTIINGELYHYGVPGMKWGKKKNNFRSTSIRSAMARRQNEKVDKSFDEWKENAKKKETAIELGKKANAARLDYLNDKSNKDLKGAYQEANKAYKKALGKNTTYRKGAIRQEVGQDNARRYLSAAKKVKKQMDSDPSNKDLQKKYNDLMSKHAVERAKARKAADVGANRSRKIASIKRGITMTVSAVATTAAVTAGVYAVNRYLTNTNTTINGKPLRFSTEKVMDVAGRAAKVKNFFKGYMY